MSQNLDFFKVTTIPPKVLLDDNSLSWKGPRNLTSFRVYVGGSINYTTVNK